MLTPLDHLSNLAVNGKSETTEFSTVRKPKNFQSNGPVNDVTSEDMRCNEEGPAAGSTSISAGSFLGVEFAQAPYHPGPYQIYMAKVPEGESLSTWNGAGNVWFKVFSAGANFTGSSLFPATCKHIMIKRPFRMSLANKMTTGPKVQDFMVPKALPSGDYLVRAEQIGLHVAGSPQFYIGCGQATVTGGGSGTPGPLVAFPGAYSKDDPAILVNINYPKPTSYTPPGPAVWSG